MNVEESSKAKSCDRLQELYEWIDNFIAPYPLSKLRKNLNITRDFSDAVLMAEILKEYFPRYVETHNYIPVSSVQSKKDNWNTLNRKILTKIGMKLSKEMIDKLANSQPGAIEKVLLDLREKLIHRCIAQQENLLSRKAGREEELSRHQMMISDEVEEEFPTLFAPVKPVVTPCPPVRESITRKFFHGILMLFWYILIGPFFYTWTFLKLAVTFGQQKEEIQNQQNEQTIIVREQPQPESLTFLKLRDELNNKNEKISSLNAKITILENTTKLKDMQIASMRTEPKGSSSDMAKDD